LGLNEPYNYFLDFYFHNKKIDLEIDGKQHEYKDRKISDKKRDEALIKNGIKVYRIKWKNINTENGKRYIQDEIQKFLEFYHNN
jgi:very-short-patch-repair endonuclease